MELKAVEYEMVMGDLSAQAGKPGLLLLVPGRQREANVMTIGWVLFGRVWEQPMCMVMVRPSRYTYGLINEAGVFTVNRMPEGFDEAVLRCGTVSGRDVDKIAEQGWTVHKGETQPAPYLEEARLHIECGTVFTTQMTKEALPPMADEFYLEGDYHTMYLGLVTGVFKHD
jgi:flavin reductase (DIM6/NTAB) family NADH-FMN oxidoreductase RutF